MKRGFTLVEVLIALGVISLLTLVLLRTASFVYRVGRDETERSGAEGSLLITMRRLEEDLLEAAPAGLSLTPDGSVLVIHPMGPISGSNLVTHENRFLHWSWDSTAKRLTRCELLDPPPSAPFDGLPKRWSPDELAALPKGDGDRVLLSLERVVNFAVLNPTGPRAVPAPEVGGPLTLRISLELPLAKTRKTLDLERVFHLRTGGSASYVPTTRP